MSPTGDALRSRARPTPLPLTVLTGFLGAGKTSLLNRLIKDPALAETAVIINEFGEIGLDHLLVERVDEAMVLLQSGCLCCALRGDLVDAFESLLRSLDNQRIVFRRVILETTGLADPAPVLQTVMAHPYLVMRYRLDGVITLVDAIHGSNTLDEHAEAVKQAAVADRIVLTKTDLINTPKQAEAIEQLRLRLRTLNPAASILDAAAGEATAARLINCGLYDPQRKIPDVARWLAEEAYAEHAHHDHHNVSRHDLNRHNDRIRAFAFATEQSIAAATFDMFLDLLRSVHGPNLLRMKGVVRISETPERPLVVHGVQHVFHPPSYLERWPDADQRTRLVFITRDVDPRTIGDLFQAFLGKIALDRPDCAALVDNPLRPFGGLDR